MRLDRWAVGLAMVIGLAGVQSAAASALPQPAGGDRLSAVSCASRSDCWAVGSTQREGTNDVGGEILHWDGHAWSTVPTAAAAGRLDSVSCSSSRDCWATGTIGNGSTYPRPLLIHWTGSEWSRVATPPVRDALFDSISCQSARNCWIAGSWHRDRTLALRWNGVRWTQTPTPDPSRFQRAITAITCVSANDCWGGAYFYAAPLRPTVAAYLMLLHWNGSSWTRAWTSHPYLGGEGSQGVALSGVLCSSRSACLAVGNATELFYPKPVAVRWDGSHWAPIATAPIRYASLDDISCASRRSCIAVGQAGQLAFGPGPRSLAERWDGVRWSRTPLPAGSDQLAGVSCATADDCWAVGHGRAGNVAVHWDGQTWSAF